MARIARLVLLLVVFMLLSGFTALVPTYVAGQDESDLAKIAINDVPPDRPLRGATVVRRSSRQGLPELNESWTRVFQGTRHTDGACGYSVEFYEPFDEATPKVITLSAVDTKTCQVEFEIGIPKSASRPAISDAVTEAAEAATAGDKSGLIEDRRRSFMAPGALSTMPGAPDAVPLMASADRKMVVFAAYKDPEFPFDAYVNRVMVSVKSRARDGKIIKGDCNGGWEWLERTGWVHEQGGKWDDWECSENHARVKGELSGHFSNNKFPGCQTNLHVYYDRVWAKVTAAKPKHKRDEGYHYGIRDHFWEGAPCGNLLRWMGLEFIPEEYWTWD